jgi:hypothetical protein
MAKLLFLYILAGTLIFFGLLILKKVARRKTVSEKLKAIHHRQFTNYDKPQFLIPLGCFLILLGTILVYKTVSSH